MMTNMTRTMQETMRLMQSGDLNAAVAAIQKNLRGDAAPTYGNRQRGTPAASGHCIEGQFQALADDDADEVVTPQGKAERHEPRNPSNGEFRAHRFNCDAGAMSYKLFVPAGLDTAGAPLIVMLHGCTQSPDDFARGTRMNLLAQVHGYVVAYPAQAQSRNAHRCWNWFRNEDQQRGRGEPALIAALTRHLVATHRLDAQRVYVAGLSAGGAMAAVLGSTHPEVYAAIGVHSGLPFGAAHDVPSAFAAMKQGGVTSARDQGIRPDPIPAIVFHGDGDTTVHPCNGGAVIAQCAGAAAAPSDPSARTTVEQGSVPGGRRYTRTIFTTADGRVAAEQWTIHGGPHAWSGGDQAGSYTDPSGPDASEEMLRFFAGFRTRVTN